MILVNFIFGLCGERKETEKNIKRKKVVNMINNVIRRVKRDIRKCGVYPEKMRRLK